MACGCFVVLLPLMNDLQSVFCFATLCVFRVICEWVIFVGGACVRKLLSTNLVGGDISLIYEHVDLLKKLGIKLNKAFTYCAFWYYDGVLWNIINKRVPKITDDLRFKFKVRFYFFLYLQQKMKKLYLS